MKWIKRERPKIDRIACLRLIKNFVDSEAEFIYAAKERLETGMKIHDAVYNWAKYAQEKSMCGIRSFKLIFE
jgi:hypothetical protein